MKLILIINKNIKKLLCIGIIIDIMSYIYCMPIDMKELFFYLIKNIVLSLFFLLMIHGARLNNKTGATRLFSKIKYAKYSEFFVALLTVVAAFLGLIIMIKKRNLIIHVYLFHPLLDYIAHQKRHVSMKLKY